MILLLQSLFIGYCLISYAYVGYLIFFFASEEDGRSRFDYRMDGKEWALAANLFLAFLFAPLIMLLFIVVYFTGYEP